MERDIPKILIGKSLLEYFSYYHVTQKMIHRLEQEKRVLINHTFLPFNTILKENDQLTLKIEDMEENHTRPFSYPLDIVYEDSDFIVINKPPFILIHPDGTDEETLSNALSSYYHKTHQPWAVHVVHRLDYETSGLVMFAKHFLSHAYLCHLFFEHKIKKEYICVVHGTFSLKQGKISLPIGKDRHQNKQRISKTGKKAETSYTVLDVKENKSLLSVQIEGGRKHQIRVHMASLHHPIVGDKLYGKKEEERLLLHCRKMTFLHPKTLSSFSVEIHEPWKW